jgi:predicted O-linked N-acetylglucosamine transferase (SPINDLY family)
MQQAVAHHFAGHLQDAEQLYRAILRMQPDHPEASRNLSLLVTALGHQKQPNSRPHKPAAKLSSRREATQQEINALAALFNQGLYVEMENTARDLTVRCPRQGIGWKALGTALMRQGRNADALEPLRKAAGLLRDDAQVHDNLGITLRGLGLHAEAAASFRQALAIKPDYAQAHNNLGILLGGQGHLAEAEASFRNALVSMPGFAEAHNNLGIILGKQSLFAAAEASYRLALAIKPDYVEALNNLGIALKEQGRLAEAEACYRRALQIRPEYVEVLNNLGVTLKELGHFANAEACFRRALEIKPDYVEAINNLGIAFEDQGQLAKAETSYRNALKIKPDYAEAHNNLGVLLKEQGQIGEAEDSHRRAIEIKPDYVEAYSNLLAALNYNVSHSPLHCLERSRQYSRMVEKKVGARFSSWQCATRPERLRVGLVSGDLNKHSVSHFLESLLAHLDPARVELYAYPTHHKTDELTARIEPYFAAWKPILGLGDEAAARLIHADGVHVLLDLSGHTAHNRLPVFAWRPAPVQVTWLGLPTTTGMAEMDYILGDPHAIPTECENQFSETVWRMPESYLCFTAPDQPLEIAPLPALSAGYVTFGSFNNLTKMNDSVVSLWARVLKSVPNSRLLLKTKQLKDLAACEKTCQRFAFSGIESDRLVLIGTLASSEDHLAMYNKVDVALDTFPYPGVTTSVEALWMGVPVLTLHGDRFISLTAESIIRNTGLSDWIADDHDSYVAKAVAFSSDLENLAVLRAGLRQRLLASPLLDAPRFARNFEAVLWGMWQCFQSQQMGGGGR